MREVVIMVPAQEFRLEIEEEEDSPLDRDSIYDYYVHSTLEDQMNYDWKVVEVD